MRTLARALLVVVPVLTSLACGGRVGLIQGDGGGGGEGGVCPPPSDIVARSYCAGDETCPLGSYDSCGNPIECTCTNGAWACLADGPACPPPPCGTMGQPDCPDAQPPPACPSPEYVVPDEGCAVSSQGTCDSDIAVYDCNGNFIGDAQCECFGGSWDCEGFGPDCPDASPPPGPCPDPGSVEQGVACFSPFQQCAGNPTTCDGAVFYDAFECDNGAWNDIAVTQCDDAGTVDAGAGAKGP